MVIVASFKIKSDEIFLMKRDNNNYLLNINFTSHSSKFYKLTRQKIVPENVWSLGDNHTIIKMSENERVDFIQNMLKMAYNRDHSNMTG